MLLIDILHLFIIFLPPLLFFVKISKNIVYLLIILYLLVPFHCNFTDNKCILTYISIKKGSLPNTKSNNQFSEVWLRWLYEPILNIINLKWNNKNLNNLVISHLYLNIILLLFKSYFIC